jgi:hypothetical protein
MLPNNPYITGNPVGNSPAFVGRADILQAVQDVMHNPQQNAIVLYGQRRIGKTSILQELEAKLPEKGAYQPVFFDLQDKTQWPLERVLKVLAQKMSDRLGQTNPYLGTEPKLTLTFSKWLSEILDNLPADTSLVLLFDEVDVLAVPESEQKGAAFLRYWRDLLNSHPKRLNSIFVSGRKIDELSNIAFSLFKEVPAQRVSLLSHNDTAKLIRLSKLNNSLIWSDDAIKKVWQLTSGHPFLTQCLCSSIWERLYSKVPDEAPTVALKDIEEAVPDALISSYQVLEWLWDGLPPAERVVASALADTGGKAITQVELEHRLSKTGNRQKVIRELDNALRLLQDWDIIKTTDNDGYRFCVELVRCWITEYKPFSQEQEKLLTRVDSKADTLYKKAQELYDERYLEDALGLLESSVKSNPYHVRANQLLSDILLEQEKYSEACEVLEKLYSYQSVAARFRLIQVLLALARSSHSEVEQLKLYERILELDAEHPEARNQSTQIQQRHEKEKLRYAKLLIKQKIATIKQFFKKVKLLAFLVGAMSLIAVLIPYVPDGYTYLRCLQGSNAKSCYRFKPWKKIEMLERQVEELKDKLLRTQQRLEEQENITTRIRYKKG